MLFTEGKMAEEKEKNENGDVFAGVIENASKSKKSERYAKNPRRLLNFWKKFQKKQEEAMKKAGISSAASKISSVRLVPLKNGKEAVKVDFVGGGGVIDAGDKAHVFRRVNREMPSPSKIRTLLAAIREKGWDAVAADLDPATKEALQKACSSAGVKMDKPKKEHKAAPQKPSHDKSGFGSPSGGKNLPNTAAFGAGLLAGKAATAEAAVADALLLDSIRKGLMAESFTGNSKPSSRSGSPSRKTVNSTLMNVRKEQEKLITEVKKGYTEIMNVIKADTVVTQVDEWRKEYYGKISGKKDEELNAHEKKVKRMVLDLNIQPSIDKENLTKEQWKARQTAVLKNLDGSIKKDFLEKKKRKDAIRNARLAAVNKVAADFSLKVLMADKGQKVNPDVLRRKALAAMPKGTATEDYLAETKRLNANVAKRRQQVKTVKTERAKAGKGKNEAARVAQKVVDDSQKLSGKPVGKTAEKSSARTQSAAKKAPVRQAAQPPAPLRGAAMTKFILDQKSAGR